MPIPEYFKRAGAPMANYSYQDIADATGYIDFYGACASTATSTYAYLLTTNGDFRSAKGGSVDLTAGETTFTFDVRLNTPRTIRGDAYIIVPFALTGTDGSSGASVYTKCQLFHYDGSTETAITSEITSETMPNPTGASTIYSITSSKLATTQKSFKAGNYLRLKVKVNYTAGTGTNYASMGFSPSNQKANWTTSRLTAMVPFRLDV